MSGGHNHKGAAAAGIDFFDIFILKMGESLSDELRWVRKIYNNKKSK
jgi:hypothetical protein